MAQEKGAASKLPSHLVPGILRGIALNAAIPLILYRLGKHYLTGSEVTALSVAALFPLGMSIVEVVRSRTLNPIALIVLVGIVVSMIGVALGGSIKLLLIRESLFTGALGIACFISLALPRPFMFYFGGYFASGNDPGRSRSSTPTGSTPIFGL